MAAEIQFSGSLGGAKGTRTWPAQTWNDTYDMAGTDAVRSSTQTANIAAVDAQGTLIVISAAIASVGMMRIKNLDANNFMTAGPRVGGTYAAFIKIPPGKTMPFHAAAAYNAMYAQGDTAAVQYEVDAYEA